ncbi:MAG: hypothetical protein H2172_11135 [Opitutus sp.]|nr:hypothetical protein [Opitutus sp.]MCS6276902.1 hypothetical protein [Opitutus sp.]MCS6301449.1 hypothetical protein [Opitutus sp.]
MYGELYRQDILSDALDQVIANDGVPGVDGFEVETLVKNEAYRAAWLLALAEEMRTKTYRPSPVPAPIHSGKFTEVSARSARRS